MKNRRSKRLEIVTEAIIFFALIALIIQIAVLIYDYIRVRTDNKGLIAVLMLVVILILATCCTVFDIVRRKIMVDKPVNAILSATERIAKGDFSVRLETAHPYGKYTEYDVIIENINTMASELRKSEILKTDFVSNVSHELKTPLTVIRNYATLLRDEEDTELRKKYAQTLMDASKRLSDLITNILKLNKLENQEIQPEYAKVNLTALLAETALSYEDLIEKKEFSLDCDLQDVEIVSSASLLEIIFNNLLSNAVKFTERGGTVSLSLTKEVDNAVIRFTDSGCGISPEVGARIFEKFYQGDTSHAQEGNGLGLALVKKVIDVLGGEISVESEIGKGSTFTVILKGSR